MKSLLSLLACCTRAFAAAPANITELKRGFQHPPDDPRIRVRWWWFGPSVTKPELEREMLAMKEGGIGGFEVQPTYPLTLEGNFPYLSDQFFDCLRLPARRPGSWDCAWICPDTPPASGCAISRLLNYIGYRMTPRPVRLVTGRFCLTCRFSG